jgi:hypothetical protein
MGAEELSDQRAARTISGDASNGIEAEKVRLGGQIDGDL